jgi:hypothetical protein
MNNTNLCYKSKAEDQGAAENVGCCESLASLLLTPSRILEYHAEEKRKKDMRQARCNRGVHSSSIEGFLRALASCSLETRSGANGLTGLCRSPSDSIPAAYGVRCKGEIKLSKNWASSWSRVRSVFIAVVETCRDCDCLGRQALVDKSTITRHSGLDTQEGNRGKYSRRWDRLISDR